MYDSFWNDGQPVGCSVCGKVMREGDVYVENEGFLVCVDCTENMDLCDILELLDLPDVLTLLRRSSDCVKTV